MTQINKLCWQNARFLNVQELGAYINHTKFQGLYLFVVIWPTKERIIETEFLLVIDMIIL